MGYLLVADIGGTNSRFATFSYSSNLSIEMTSSIWIDTRSASSFSKLLELAEPQLQQKLSQYDAVVIAVAGPVENGTSCVPTNIDWELIDRFVLESSFGCSRCLLINDFVAQAFASQTKAGHDAISILEGGAAPWGAIATVGAGTGFGKVLVVRDPSGTCIVNPSEGGHVNVAVETEREFEFFQSLSAELGGFAVWDDVLSGIGLTRIHKFLYNEVLTPEQVVMASGSKPETLDWFSTFLGRACRNFALDTLATGGVFIAGGVVAQNPQIATSPKFALEFRKSRMHAALLSRIPVKLITDRDSGLWGGAYYALNHFSNLVEK